MAKSVEKREFAAERQMRLRQREKELQQLHTDGVGTGGALSAAIDPSGVTNSDLLEEIRALQAQIAELKSDQDTASSQGEITEAADARVEIAQMVRAIGQAKAEIASIKHPYLEEDDRVVSASSELDAIVRSTETATNRILEANEKIEKLINEVGRTHHDDEDIQVMVDKAAQQVIEIFEASNFQDITGQRVNKVIKTLRYIEDRIIAMIEIWGQEAFQDLPVDQARAHSDSEDDLMNGPQLENEGITQDDIDKLFD